MVTLSPEFLFMFFWPLGMARETCVGSPQSVRTALFSPMVAEGLHFPE